MPLRAALYLRCATTERRAGVSSHVGDDRSRFSAAATLIKLITRKALAQDAVAFPIENQRQEP